jgi:hypothetical protein
MSWRVDELAAGLSAPRSQPAPPAARRCLRLLALTRGALWRVRLPILRCRHPASALFVLRLKVRSPCEKSVKHAAHADVASARAAGRARSPRDPARTNTRALTHWPLRAMDAQATIAAIVALQKRAAEHGSIVKCGYAAAAEKLQEAVVLAQRLPGLPENNLVSLYLQMERCKFLREQGARMRRMPGGDEDASRGFIRSARSAFLLAIDALFRRMDTGTLQPGRCAPLEGAYLVAFSTDVVGLRINESDRAQYGQLIGLAATYAAAEEAVLEVLVLGTYRTVHPEMLTLIVRALDSLSEPRPLRHIMLASESMFVRAMQEYLKNTVPARIAVAHPACSGLLQQIRDAWARVQASGILQRTAIHCFPDADETEMREAHRRRNQAADAREARRGLRSCGLASCGAKEAHLDHFKRCGACRADIGRAG